MSAPQKRGRAPDAKPFGPPSKQGRAADGTGLRRTLTTAGSASSVSRAEEKSASPTLKPASAARGPHVYSPAELLQLIEEDRIRAMPPRRNPNGGKSLQLEVNDPRPDYRQLRIRLGPFRLAFVPDVHKGPGEQPVANLEGSADGYPGVAKLDQLIEALQALDELVLHKSTLPQEEGGLGISDRPLSRESAVTVYKTIVKERGDGRPPTIRIKVRRLKDDGSNSSRATMAYDVEHRSIDPAFLAKDSTFTAVVEPSVWQVGSGFGIGFYANQLIASTVAEATYPILGAEDLMLEPADAGAYSYPYPGSGSGSGFAHTDVAFADLDGAAAAAAAEEEEPA